MATSTAFVEIDPLPLVSGTPKHSDVDIPVIENAINERTMAARVSRVKQGRFHRGNTQGTQVRGRAIDFY